ncbi:MAG: SelB C-terminal domain-containing protein [Candidatus Aminicenantes bacterium]|nr:SelB C-terminal domain-containing protein [Candidatus Aminicenantes bacterium]
MAVRFQRIEGDCFTVHFKSQVGLVFGQKVSFKNARMSFTVLLPVLSRYNRRKLKRVSGILQAIERKDFRQIVQELLSVENFLQADRLLGFFPLDKRQALDMLTQLELAREAKVIGLSDLFLTSWEHYRQHLAAMESVLRVAYEGRERTVKYARLEKAVKIPPESVFFRYLLKKCSREFPCKILPQALVFSALPLSAEEKGRMAAIEKALRGGRQVVFTFENVQKNTSYTARQINDSLWYLLNEDKILQLDERHFIFSDEYNKIINRLKKFKRNQGDILTIEDLRSLTSYSRKYIIVLFEYWDRKNVTRRLGNKRQILLGA